MSRHHHVHLGDRLKAIADIHAGTTTAEQAAQELHVATEDVRLWMELHAGDRIVTLDEVRVSPDVQRLSRRAQRLVELIESADATIRILNRMLADMSAAPRDA